MESVRKSRRKFVPDWVRAPNASPKEKKAVWQLAAQGYEIQAIKEKLERKAIGLDRQTISKIIREAIEEPAIPPEQVKKLDPVVREWIISKRPHIKDTVLGTGQPEKQTPSKPSVSAEERQRYWALLQQWREQAQFIPVGKLMYLYRFGHWSPAFMLEGQDLSKLSESDLLRLKALESVQPVVADGGRMSLTVESEVTFQQLKRVYPTSGVWQAQESWHIENSNYMSAFLSWLRAVHFSIELSMALNLVGHDGKASSTNSDQIRQSFRQRFLSESLFSFRNVQDIRDKECYLAAELILLAVGRHLPRDADFRSYQLGGLLQATSPSEVTIMMAPSLLEGALEGVTPQSVWEDDREVREKTEELLESVDRLYAVHTALHQELRALEMAVTGTTSESGASSD